MSFRQAESLVCYTAVLTPRSEQGSPHRRSRSYQESVSPDGGSSMSTRDARELGLDGPIGRYRYDTPMLSPYSSPAPSVGRRTPVPYSASDPYNQRRRTRTGREY